MLEAADLSHARAPLEAVLFDLDGTLVDTMPLHFQAYRDVLAEIGIPLTFEHFMEVSGGAARETIPRLVGAHRCDLSVEDIHGRKVKRAEALFRDIRPQALPCALLLPLFAQSHPVGLVSSGSRKSVATTLEVMSWTSLFTTIVTGDDVARAKPAPDGYLKAAAALSVDPERCLVFEDMDDGVIAAEAAGMRVFDVRRTLPAWRATLGTQ
jgi:beta-phosphoglucomutase-like phosphatase (HAD superfamily)